MKFILQHYRRKRMSRFILRQNTILTLGFILIAFFAFHSKSEAQCAMACNATVFVSLNETGSVTITPDILLEEVTPDCEGDYTIEVTDIQGNNYGNIVTGENVDDLLNYNITNNDSGNSCSGNLIVIDQLPPVFSCIDTFIYCTVPNTPDVIGYPDVSDNASEINNEDLTFEDEFFDLACFTTVNDHIVTAKIERTWYASDESGNVSSCVQNIYLLRATFDDIIFPLDFDDFEAPSLSCDEDPTDLSVTGQPMIAGYVMDNASSCELIVSNSDQVLEICGGETKTIRTWTIYDVCTDDYTLHVQIIMAKDTEAPVVTCPENLLLNTYTDNCVTTVTLLPPEVTDNCSTVTVTPSWEFGTGYGPFSNVPVGEYTVTYVVEDDCGNASECTSQVIVEDDDSPTAICEPEIALSLQEDGTGFIYANTFDNGSHDNCAIDHFEVSRDGENFDEFVYFSCEDIVPSPVEVTLLVVDIHGLTATCVSSVVVTDEVTPEITCPSDVSITCGESYEPENTGFAVAIDDCGIASLDYSDVVNLNQCGNGEIIRTWTTSDESGNSNSCTQHIYLNDITQVEVVFPEDYTTYECGAATTTDITGEPVITGFDCEDLEVTHTDYTFYTAYPSCYKIIRNWLVIDWCVFDPDSGSEEGYWENTQVIWVLDDEPPVLNCLPDITVGIQNQSCETFVLLDAITAEDCSEELTFFNNSPFATNADADASGVYPIGTHEITFSVADGCGNTDECTMTLTVVDAQPPSPVCNNGVSVTINQDGHVALTVEMIENGSYDNCADISELSFEISPSDFTCEDIGDQTVTLTVTDPSGNSSYCQTVIVVQDNLDVCQSLAVSGNISNEYGEALIGMAVNLEGGLSLLADSDENGNYHFNDIPRGGNYTITPYFDEDASNGVTAYDIILIRKHILYIEPFNSPYKIIAADVNKSGSISTFDLVLLSKIILHLDTAFTDNTSWRFVDGSYDFNGIPENPFAYPLPENIVIDNLSDDSFGNNFIGIKTGDVNNSANLNNFSGIEQRDDVPDLLFKINEEKIKRGQEYRVPFKAKDFNNILGYQFTIEFDEDVLEYRDIEFGITSLEKSNFNLTQTTNGIITTYWENIQDTDFEDDTEIFSLVFTAKGNGDLSSLLQINSSITRAEAYTGKMQEINQNINIKGVALEFKQQENMGFSLLQNKPNPFHEKTMIGFILPEKTEVTLRIYDILGKKLKEIKGTYFDGYNEIEINDLKGQPGVLFYELSTPDGLQMTKKMTIF